MLGQVKYTRGAWGTPETGRLYGLPVLRAHTDPAGWLGEFRLHRVGRILYRGGVRRALVPEGFEGWPLLLEKGVSPVDPTPLLHHQGARLALEGLHRSGTPPERAVVSLWGRRVDRAIERAARSLCARVRHVSVCTELGGEELALLLHREYGMPIVPAGEGAQLALCFGPGSEAAADQILKLYGPMPGLAGLRVTVPGLQNGDREDLSLITALWEGGKLDECDLKIT